MQALLSNISIAALVGDCYVAATGIPDPRPDHTVSMVSLQIKNLSKDYWIILTINFTFQVRFGHDIIKVMSRAVKALEVSLGPDTCDLGLRVGVHTGPVTAGVLRG